ncbi:hypothetical protein C7B76_24265 [filamentous cyanobacterium CCP2]|nr:hypothetical protein C7B76_24265 [filamentous cyanobacterium CCP2]
MILVMGKLNGEPDLLSGRGFTLDATFCSNSIVMINEVMAKSRKVRTIVGTKQVPSSLGMQTFPIILVIFLWHEP